MTRTNSLSQVRFSTLIHWAIAVSLVFISCSSGVARAQSASGWNKRGQEAELKQDYDTAYECYLQAHQKNPKDLRYEERLDRMRFQAAAQHVDRGRVLRQNGDIPGALNQFTRALQIDPGNQAAAQEIKITQNQDKSSMTAPQPAPGTAESNAVMRDVASITAPIELKPVSDEPITFHATEDTKYIYTAIGKLAGLNVLFDPDYQSRRVPVDLTNVSLPDALRIVGTLSGTFYKTVTPDTIYVAQNTPDKHRNLDEMAVQTFYLTSPTAQADANEIYTALRNLLPADNVKSYFVPSQNAIVVRGTKDDLLLAEKLLNDLDRDKSEVVVDVAILEVNRDKIRNLGITLPQSVTVTPQGTNTTTTSSSSSTTGSTTSTSNGGLTLNTLAHSNANNYAVSISGGTVNALLTDADTRVLQNPSIRATDGKQATLKIGSRIPVATGSYSAGAATGITAGIGVQTQFSYIDVGVNIDMTPTIHLDRQVTLNLAVDVSNQTGSVTISGVTEPIIGQRTSKSVIQLRDGEPCLLAGILSKNDTINVTGTPGLAEIPVLKYIFGSNYREAAQDEVVFVLIPHVVRESTVTRLNTRAVDTGTANEYQIRQQPSALDALFPDSAARQNPAPSPTSAANAASAMVDQIKQQAMPPTPGSQVPPVAPPQPTQPAVPETPATGSSPATSQPAQAPVALLVNPPDSTQALNSTFRAAVVLAGGHDVYSVPVQVQFDPKILQLVNVQEGGYLAKDGQAPALVHRDDGNGLVTISVSRPPGVKGVSGDGQVCVLTFKAIGPGDSKVALVKVGAKNSTQASLPAIGSQATVHVK